MSESSVQPLVVARIRSDFEVDDGTRATLNRLERALQSEPDSRNRRRDLASALVDAPGGLERAVATFLMLDANEDTDDAQLRRCEAAFELIAVHRQLLRRHEAASAAGASLELIVSARKHFMNTLTSVTTKDAIDVRDLELELALAPSLGSLSEQNASILRRRFGLVDSSVAGILKNVEEHYSFSHERIAQLRERGLRQLRRRLTSSRPSAPLRDPPECTRSSVPRVEDGHQRRAAAASSSSGS